MRKINKILIISFLVGFCLFNFSLADNSDCRNFSVLRYQQNWRKKAWFDIVTQVWWTEENKFSNFLNIDQQNAIIDTDSLNTAILNLKKYCCEHGDSNKSRWITQNSATCISDKTFFNDNALESPYLFDHIFDVMMRRLAWLTWEKNIYEKTNMTVDEKWAERRARITEKAESTWWATPQVIIDQYQETRKTSPAELGYDISSKIYASFEKDKLTFLEYVSWQWKSKESQDVANAIKQYDQWTLYDRYSNACAMTEYLYSLLSYWIDSSDTAHTINRVSDWRCHNFVTEQIDAENAYVKLVIQQSSNLFLSNYILWYMDYLRERSNNLRSTQTKIKNNFLNIVRGVPKLIKQCVH